MTFDDRLVRWGVLAAMLLASTCAVAGDPPVPPSQDIDAAQTEAKTEPADGAASPQAAQDPAPGASSILGVALKELSATRERPVFSPSRRPPFAAAAPVDIPEPPPVIKSAAPERPSLSLIGTVRGGAHGLGVFLSQTNNDVIRLHVGEATDGWTLRSVDRRRTILEKDKQEVTLEIPAPGGETAQAPSLPPRYPAGAERMPPGMPPRLPPSPPPPPPGSPRFGGRHFQR